MIIDTHVHLIGMDPLYGCRLGPKLRRGPLLWMMKRVFGLSSVPSERLDEAYRNLLLKYVRTSSIDAFGVLALDGVYDAAGRLDEPRTQMMTGNDYCFEVCAQDDRLLPVASVNPQRRDAIEELERVAELGAVAIKTLPNSQGFDPLSGAYLKFWQKMADLKLPLLSHTSFEHTVPPINQLYGHPLRLRLPLEQGVCVIAAHCAGAGVVHPIREHFGMWLTMLKEHDNLYGDISAMASISRFPYIHKVLASERAISRVVLGSDYPIPIHPVVFTPTLGVLKVRKLVAMKNPLQRNLETFRALGVDDLVFARAAQLLRL